MEAIMGKVSMAAALAAALVCGGISGCAHDRPGGEQAQGGLGHTADFNAGYDGAGPDHNLRAGDSLPSRYRTRQYVVDNWQMHKLSAPPAGSHWIQAGADYLLVSGETGLIERIVAGR
jgi:Ni/Co efflux regulator RcnB